MARDETLKFRSIMKYIIWRLWDVKLGSLHVSHVLTYSFTVFGCVAVCVSNLHFYWSKNAVVCKKEELMYPVVLHNFCYFIERKLLIKQCLVMSVSCVD